MNFLVMILIFNNKKKWSSLIKRGKLHQNEVNGLSKNPKIGKLPPEKFPTIKLPPGKSPPENLSPRKFPPGIFPPIFLNIPIQVFEIFCFSLLSPLSLIYLKDCFVILCFNVLKTLKADFFDCYIIKKSFARQVLHGELSSLTPLFG